MAPNAIPERPDHGEVDQLTEPAAPTRPFVVVRKKRHLRLKQDEDRRSDQRDQSDQPEGETLEMCRCSLGPARNCKMRNV